MEHQTLIAAMTAENEVRRIHNLCWKEPKNRAHVDDLKAAMAAARAARAAYTAETGKPFVYEAGLGAAAAAGIAKEDAAAQSAGR